MRIFVATDRLALVGGSERYTAAVVRALAERGHDVYVACAHEERGDDGLVTRARGERGARDEAATGARVEHHPHVVDARRAAHAFAPDVVLVSSASEPALVRTLLEVAPLVRHVQDHTLFCPGLNKMHEDGSTCTSPMGLECLRRYWLDGGCTGFKPRAIDGASRTAQLAPWTSAHRVVARLRDLATHARCAQLIVGSRYMQGELALAGLARERVSVIPYFTRSNTSDVPPAILPEETRHFLASGDAPLIVTPARLALPDKGIDYLITALALVKHPMRALIAGSGPAEAWLRDKAAREGLADRVHFTGWLSAGQIESAYAAARVVAFPSVWNEPFGLVGLEAMAHARPVVAFEGGAVREWLIDGETGYAVPRKDVAALAHRIDALLADESLARTLGQAGAMRNRDHYSRERHMDTLETILKRVT